MSERENGRLTLAKRTVRNTIPPFLGAIKALNTKRKQTSHAVIPPEIGRRRERLSFRRSFRELGVCNPVVVNVTQSSALLALLDEPVWFCLKAQPKREHLAAIALRRQFGIECFSPRLRFRKMTNRGAGVVRGSDVSRLSVHEICVFETTSRC